MASTPTIQFYGGIGTIGGTKIIVQDGEYRVFFDFGLNYAPGGDFWGGRVQPRSGPARLRDLLTLGYVPALDGIYHPEFASSAGLKGGWDGKTHVFISHLHLDHMAVVDLLASDVPVWFHEESLRLFRTVAETGERPGVPAGALSFRWDEPIQIGPITVTPVAVDHDIPGAAALLIETSDGTVVYSGDLRLHGPRPDLVDQFVVKARATHPKILLIEGTRLGEPDGTPDKPVVMSETEVGPHVANQVAEATGLALITLYPRNTERIGSIATEVAKVGRTLALSPEAAHIFAAMGGNLDSVALYLRYGDKGALANGTAESWLKELVASGVRTVDAQAVRSNQREYLLQLFFWDINELVDLEPAPGSVFIHSNGEPLGRFDPSYDLFLRWLTRFNLTLLAAYSTGHAAPEDLKQVVAGIKPHLLVPIHSHHPELLEVDGIRRELPELGAWYAIGTGERVK